MCPKNAGCICFYGTKTEAKVESSRLFDESLRFDGTLPISPQFRKLYDIPKWNLKKILGLYIVLE
jgi:hypothetical protein